MSQKWSHYRLGPVLIQIPSRNLLSQLLPIILTTTVTQLWLKILVRLQARSAQTETRPSEINRTLTYQDPTVSHFRNDTRHSLILAKWLLL